MGQAREGALDKQWRKIGKKEELAAVSSGEASGGAQRQKQEQGQKLWKSEEQSPGWQGKNSWWVGYQTQGYLSLP